MYNINNIADYVIARLTTGTTDKSLNSLKLQKLLYYIQAWNLAFHKKPIFEGKFKAWIHGPVNREIYDRFKDKMLFFPIDANDVIDSNSVNSLDKQNKLHIDLVLESYSVFSGVELENMTHSEDPWIFARKGYAPNERCDNEIDETMMGDYYRARLNA